MKRTSKTFFTLLTVATALFILTVSIAFPILCRPFYYLQIAPLGIEETTGYPYEVIVDAYDEMLDFCVFDAPFGTGALPFSMSGKSHFVDVAALFQLDLTIAVGSAVVLLFCALLHFARGLRPRRPLGRGFGFWGSISLVVVLAVVAVLCAIDFTRAFVVFHGLFFPGQDNWIFDPATDPIINILPELFFRNCAIAIGVVLFALCAILIALDFRPKRRK